MIPENTRPGTVVECLASREMLLGEVVERRRYIVARMANPLKRPGGLRAVLEGMPHVFWMRRRFRIVELPPELARLQTQSVEEFERETT